MESKSVCVFKENFEKKLSELMFKDNSVSITSKENYGQLINEVIEAKNKEKKTSLDYRRLRRYDVLTVGTTTKLIIPLNKSVNNEVKYFVHNGEIFEILKKAHIETGHGGLHKMHNAVRSKYVNIPRQIIQLFLSHCETCAKKRAHQKKGVVVKPMVFNEVNSRGQVDLIDMQSCKDRYFKFIMNYQDHLSKFLILRPLKTKTATEVSYNLIDIFCIFGAPSILQSDNGREFVNSVIEELTVMWPQLKIVHGKPRHSQSQGSVERANRDVEEMIRAWMIDNGSTQWSEGLRFCQYQKNNSLHSGIKQSPFEALFGRKAKLGLASSTLPASVIESLNSEEDVETIIGSMTNEISEETEESEQIEEREVQSTKEMSVNKETEKPDQTEEREVQTTEEMSVNEETEKSDQTEEREVQTTEEMSVNEETEKSDQIEEREVQTTEEIALNVEEMSILNKLHLNIQKNQQIAVSGLQQQAKRMKLQSDSKYPPLQCGTTVTIPVPDVDRSKGDLRNLIGVVMEVTSDNFYKIGTKKGVLSQLYSRNQIAPCNTTFLEIEEVADASVSLRAANSQASIVGGQGFVRCACTRKCLNKRCVCRKKGVLCNSRCHNSMDCTNK